MSVERQKEIASLLSELEAARGALQHARRQLALVNAHIKKGQKWECELAIEKDSYGYVRHSIRHEIHAEHVQQRCVDNVKAAERRVTQLEMRLPPGVG